MNEYEYYDQMRNVNPLARRETANTGWGMESPGPEPLTTRRQVTITQLSDRRFTVETFEFDSGTGYWAELGERAEPNLSMALVTAQRQLTM